VALESDPPSESLDPADPLDEETDEVFAVDLEDFLGMKAYKVVEEIADRERRGRVISAIQSCAKTLQILDDLDLSPHELADLETPNVAAWEALAPDLRDVLVAVRGTCDYVVSLFPSSGERPEKEAEFTDPFGSLEDEDTMSGLRGQLIDNIVQGSSDKDDTNIGDSITMLTEVLRNDTVGFGGKLRNPQVVADRWFLLGEVHQFLGQCAQCLEALVATILSGVSNEALGEMLPRYLDVSMRAIMLRKAVVDLAYDMEQFNIRIGQLEARDVPAAHAALVGQLQAFSTTAEYKLLKPQDKRAVILFRIFLNGWAQKGSDAEVLRQEVEGFAKFLALMRDISWRDVLGDHDKKKLKEVRRLLTSGSRLAAIMPALLEVYGNSEPLDEAIRSIVRKRVAPPREELTRLITEAEARMGI
jgi:hypothetical protein